LGFSAMRGVYQPTRVAATVAVYPDAVFPGDAKHRTRNLEIPGLVLRTIPE